MIKNWVVKVEQIKVSSIDRHKRYLLDQKHENHLSSSILSVYKGKSFDLAFEERKKRLEEAGRPDRSSYKNYATSFVFGPPGNFTISQEQAKKITGSVISAVASAVGIEKEILAKYVVSVVHNEKSPKNSHFHFLISNVVDGEFRKGITQNKAKYAIQKALDVEYKRHFKLDRKSYEPENTGQKTKPLWKARQDKRLKKLLRSYRQWFEKTAARSKIILEEKAEIEAKQGFFKKVFHLAKQSFSNAGKEDALKAADNLVLEAVETYGEKDKKADLEDFLCPVIEHEKNLEDDLKVSEKIIKKVNQKIESDEEIDRIKRETFKKLKEAEKKKKTSRQSRAAAVRKKKNK